MTYMLIMLLAFSFDVLVLSALVRNNRLLGGYMYSCIPLSHELIPTELESTVKRLLLQNGGVSGPNGCLLSVVSPSMVARSPRHEFKHC